MGYSYRCLIAKSGIIKKKSDIRIYLQSCNVCVLLSSLISFLNSLFLNIHWSNEIITCTSKNDHEPGLNQLRKKKMDQGWTESVK